MTQTIIVSVLTASLLLGCSGKTGVKNDTGKATGHYGSDASTQGFANGQGLNGNAVQNGHDSAGSSPLNDPNSPLSQRIIYFMYDSSEIQPEYRPVIRIHSEYLMANPGLSIVIEGHADERGSREYNIALGEQRAASVAKLMRFQGVANHQISTVSYGEEKPIEYGHDEAAWNMNRRAELTYPGVNN